MASDILDELLYYDNYPDIWDDLHYYVSQKLNTTGVILQFNSVERPHTKDIDDKYFTLSLRFKKSNIVEDTLPWHYRDFNIWSELDPNAERTTKAHVYFFNGEKIQANIANTILNKFGLDLVKTLTRSDNENIYLDLYFKSESSLKEYFKELKLQPIIYLNVQISPESNSDLRVDFYEKTFLRNNRKFVRKYIEIAKDKMFNELDMVKEQSGLFPFTIKPLNLNKKGYVESIIFYQMSIYFVDIKAQYKLDLDAIKEEIKSGKRDASLPIEIEDGRSEINAFVESDYLDSDYDDLLLMIYPQFDEFVEKYRNQFEKLLGIQKKYEENDL